jgi:hypothetical protein
MDRTARDERAALEPIALEQLTVIQAASLLGTPSADHHGPVGPESRDRRTSRTPLPYCSPPVRGSGGAGLAAAVIAVPLTTGAESPAYAATKNTDGTITVRTNEFKDAGCHAPRWRRQPADRRQSQAAGKANRPARRRAMPGATNVIALRLTGRPLTSYRRCKPWNGCSPARVFRRPHAEDSPDGRSCSGCRRSCVPDR